MVAGLTIERDVLVSRSGPAERATSLNPFNSVGIVVIVAIVVAITTSGHSNLT